MGGQRNLRVNIGWEQEKKLKLKQEKRKRQK